MKRNIMLFGYISWCGLGFYRGINQYKYKINKNFNVNKPYLHTNSVLEGVLGFAIYANPAMMPITIYKEIYRIEQQILQLHDKIFKLNEKISYLK